MKQSEVCDKNRVPAKRSFVGKGGAAKRASFSRKRESERYKACAETDRDDQRLEKERQRLGYYKDVRSTIPQKDRSCLFVEASSKEVG